MNRADLFHHYVCDKNGHIEMEIWFNPKNYEFSVHYPRFECSSARMGEATSFQKFGMAQLGMMIFAYSEEEYMRLETALINFFKNNSQGETEDDGKD